MEILVKQQKVRYIGVSNFNVKQLQRILAVRDLEYKPICNQVIRINRKQYKHLVVCYL